MLHTRATTTATSTAVTIPGVPGAFGFAILPEGWSAGAAREFALTLPTSPRTLVGLSGKRARVGCRLFS